MRYIMITDFPNHWDKIKGNLTLYPPKMVKKLKPNTLKAGVETIFIKKSNGSMVVDKAWSRKVHDIQKIPETIFLFLLCAVIVFTLHFSIKTRAISYLIFYSIQFLITMISARNYGDRFVCNVLAEESTLS